MGQGIDGPLSDEGLVQAQLLAERLCKESISHVYTSDLQRAVHTAQVVAQLHPKAIMKSDPALRERNLGIYEGRPNTEWKAAMERSLLPFHSYKPENGESYTELHERVSKFFDRILKERTKDTILFVSHTGTLTMLLIHVLGLPITKEMYEKYRPGNTAVTIMEYDSLNKLKLETLNSVEHLEQSTVNA